ncbi:MAG: hypothetical protein FRX49_11244 [Trebouxia sp. A1-2]|nr:MAG: hypothetical protein FRX49_11244 [Trebouxia sp. A1-2]
MRWLAVGQIQAGGVDHPDQQMCLTAVGQQHWALAHQLYWLAAERVLLRTWWGSLKQWLIDVRQLLPDWSEARPVLANLEGPLEGTPLYLATGESSSSESLDGVAALERTGRGAALRCGLAASRSSSSALAAAAAAACSCRATSKHLMKR